MATSPSPLESLTQLYHELRRRHVAHVAAVYLGVGWLVSELATTIVPSLLLPEWIARAVIVVIILGFPIAMVLAWALEITPEGVRRTGSAGSATAEAEVKALPTVAAANTLAVLPFANLSATPEDEYLSDGLAEEMLDAISRSTSLRVASRTSAFAFKHRAANVRTIGRHLEVARVLEGSVRRVRDQLRVRVQLTDTSTGFETWSATYQRSADDLFALQEETARAVVLALRGQEGDEESQVGIARSTEDRRAYDEYLRGRHAWNERTCEGLDRAVEHFRTAIRLDPSYTLAHVGLAESFVLLLEYGLASPESVDPESAALRAVELDRSSGPAWRALALARQLSWDWAGAEEAFKRALQLDPRHAVAHHRRSLLLAYLGRFPEAEREIAAARALDPHAPIIAVTAAWIQVYAGRPELALPGFREAADRFPEFPVTHVAASMAHSALGDHAEAAASLRRAVALGSDTPVNRALLAHALGRAGKRAEAEALVDRLTGTPDCYLPPFHLALAYLGLGREEEAWAWLERARVERSPHLVYLNVDPHLEPLRAHPRFDHLRREVGLDAVPPLLHTSPAPGLPV